VLGTQQNFAEVFFGEVRAEHQEAREVELTQSDRAPQSRKAADEASSGDAAKGFVLGKAELVDAISVEARTGTGPVDAARLDLAEVAEQGGKELVRPTDEAPRRRE
jgi:hypothetical protein